jgi:hypothetical protein
MSSNSLHTPTLLRSTTTTPQRSSRLLNMQLTAATILALVAPTLALVRRQTAPDNTGGTDPGYNLCLELTGDSKYGPRYCPTSEYVGCFKREYDFKCPTAPLLNTGSDDTDDRSNQRCFGIFHPRRKT